MRHSPQRHYAVAAALEPFSLYAQHHRDIRSVNIRIGNSNLKTLSSQCNPQIRCYGTLAYPALVAHHNDFVSNLFHTLCNCPLVVFYLIQLTGQLLLTKLTGNRNLTFWHHIPFLNTLYAIYLSATILIAHVLFMVLQVYSQTPQPTHLS